MATLVTNTGYAIVSGRLIGSTPTQVEPKYIGWGTGSGTTAVSDVALFTQAPEARVTGTSSQQTTTTTNDTYQVVGTITASTTETITNVGLFDVSTSAPQTSLAAAVTSSGQTTITVASASGFPGSGNFAIQVGPEAMLVTGGQGTTTWTVTRGYNGSTAQSSIASATSVTGGPTTSGGNLFVKSDFTGLSLNNGDQITFTISVAVS